MTSNTQPNEDAVLSPSDPFLRDDAFSTVLGLSISTVPTPTNRVHSLAARSEDSWILRARLGHGITLHGITGGQPSSISFSSKRIATCQEPFFEYISTSDTVLSSTTSAEGNGFYRLGFSRQATEDATHWSKLLDESTRKDGVPVLHVTCRQVTTKVVVTTDLGDLEPHPDFIQALEKAMTLSTKDEQALALKRALRRWGALVATRLELGCALVSTSTFVAPTLDGIIADVHDRRAQLHAEDIVRTAVQRTNPAAVNSTRGEGDPLRVLDVKVVGGTAKMQLENPEVWAITGIHGVHSSLELLRELHGDLYAKVCEVVSHLEARLATKPRLPILHFPGRLVSCRYQNRDSRRMTGFMQLDLPDFNPSKDFTVSAWIMGGNQGGNAIPLSIECAEESCALLDIGTWDRQDIIKVLRRTLCVPAATTPPVAIWINSKITYQQDVWIHVAYVEYRGRMFLYMDGVIAASGSLPVVEHNKVTQTRLCIGRSSHSGNVCDQWDGVVENVKVWDRALSATDVEGEADISHRPAPTGVRYP